MFSSPLQRGAAARQRVKTKMATKAAPPKVQEKYPEQFMMAKNNG